jgi:tetratricopeptide (TPR) repeat protein
LKAFIYTVVLTGVLVVSIVFLRSLSGDELKAPKTVRKPMVVKSAPPALSELDAAELEGANRDALYETGLEMLDLWHLFEAVEVFENVVAQDTAHAWAYLKLVECCAHPIVARERRARECWRRAGDALTGDAADTLLISAYKDLFLEPSYASAADKLKKIVQGGELGAETGYLLALALYKADRPGEAEGYLHDLLQQDESLGRVRELLILCHVARGELDRAEALAKDLATIYPEEPYPYVLLSQVQLLQGRVESAVGFCRNALVLDDKYIPAIVARAHLYVAQEEREAARVSFEKLQLFDDPMLASTGFEGMAYVGFLSGDFDLAIQEMDDAIRMAISAGSMRRGLMHALQLVDYLCQLGRPNAAADVAERWMSRPGRIPLQLAKLRIRIAEGDLKTARHILNKIEDNRRWRMWMRFLDLDSDDFEALALIKEKKLNQALSLLDSGSVRAGTGARHAYLRGFASFEKGEAEAAAGFFREVLGRHGSLEYPYHNDPILHVQSIFFLAEAILARGESEEAAGYYEEFLGYWGKSDWDLQAVGRAREKSDMLMENNRKG